MTDLSIIISIVAIIFYAIAMTYLYYTMRRVVKRHKDELKKLRKRVNELEGKTTTVDVLEQQMVKFQNDINKVAKTASGDVCDEKPNIPD